MRTNASEDGMEASARGGLASVVEGRLPCTVGNWSLLHPVTVRFRHNRSLGQPFAAGGMRAVLRREQDLPAGGWFNAAVAVVMASWS